MPAVAPRRLLRTTPCLGWWFGGPHRWPRLGDCCEICGKTRLETQRPLEEVREMWRKLPEIRAAQLDKASE